MDYLLLPKELRTDHIDLLLPCHQGDPVTARQLADYLGLDSTPTDIACLCGTNCSNPRHYFFAKSNERLWVKSTSGRNRIRLIIEKYGLNLTLQDIADRSHTKKQMVTKYLKEQGLERPSIIKGKDGTLYASKKNNKIARVPERLLKLTDGIDEQWAEEIRALAQRIKMANEQ